MIPDHWKILFCEEHKEEVEENHLSQCKHLKIDYQVVSNIKRDILLGKHLMSVEGLKQLMRNLENVHSKIIDAECKKKAVVKWKQELDGAKEWA